MTYKIAVIEGDGIGPDLIRVGKGILEALQSVSDLKFEFYDAPAGGRCYLERDTPLPHETLDICRASNAVLKGPVGLPNLPQGTVEQGMLLPLRQELGQYVNLRPTKVYPELVPVSHLRPEYIEGTDFIVVRENSEGLYSLVGGIRGRVKHKSPRVVELLNELMEELHADAMDVSIYSQKGVDRILRYALDLAMKRRKHDVAIPTDLRRVASADKANVIYTSQFWRERFIEISKEYPQLTRVIESVYIDAQNAFLVRHPNKYDVIVTDNLFGDILTDLATEITGSLGLGGSGNINPEGISMFEPIHGSAPDIVGKNIANPIGMVMAAKLMIETLGHPEEAKLLEDAVVKALQQGLRTKDISFGEECCSTEEMGAAIAENVRRSRN